MTELYGALSKLRDYDIIIKTCLKKVESSFTYDENECAIDIILGLFNQNVELKAQIDLMKGDS